MDDRRRYDLAKSRLKAMGEGTAQQVHESMNEESQRACSIRDVENTLDELVINEKEEFTKTGDVYRWTKHYRFREAPETHAN